MKSLLPSAEPRVTVAICTHDRAASLATTLETLVDQAGVESPWELLLVANACSDATSDVAQGFQDRLPLRLVHEPTRGLSHARNRALAEARGDLLIFTDDDVRHDPGWLRSYVEAAGRYPDAEYFAGRILSDWGGPPPRWFRAETAHWFDGVLVGLDLGEGSRPMVDTDPLPIGASFALRRALFERNGGFRTDLGVRGTENGRGEETEYLLRARRAGADGAYVGAALCRHPVDRARFRLTRLYRHGVASGVAYRSIQAPDQAGSIARAMLFPARGGLQLLKGRGDRFRRCVLNSGIEVGLRRAAEADSG